MNRKSYPDHKSQLLGENALSEEIYEANELLRKYNWQFIHPYLQVFKITSIIKKEKENQLTKAEVSTFFINDFYNLDSTLSFVDGFFKRSKYFQPYLYYIEQSLILCFQKDYAGAITILLPWIEGILADFLTDQEGITLKKYRYEKIRSSISKLKMKLIEQTESGYNSPESTEYNPQQIKQLLKMERTYFDNWFAGIESFFEQSFFTPSDQLQDHVELNRHVIAHALEPEQYDTLDNYIKLFNSLRFLVWALLMIEKKSILNEIDTDTFLRKRLLYEEIIENAEKVSSIKSRILDSYPLYNRQQHFLKTNYKSILKNQPFYTKLLLHIKRFLILKTNRQ